MTNSWSKASNTTIPSSSIALDKNPFFYSIYSIPGSELFVGFVFLWYQVFLAYQKKTVKNITFFNISFFGIPSTNHKASWVFLKPSFPDIIICLLLSRENLINFIDSRIGLFLKQLGKFDGIVNSSDYISPKENNFFLTFLKGFL